MGEAELFEFSRELIIRSHIVTYGNAANQELTERIREEIERMWNEADGEIYFDNELYKVKFTITAEYIPEIDPLIIYQNTDPKNNYFRIEEFVHGNISFVDGIGSNTGYFKVENIYKGSTTAAHEYGHTLGLVHPYDLDLRGQGTPGIMYPRGTLVDPDFQYNPEARPGDNTRGGTMHPQHRKVTRHDLELLKLHKLDFNEGKAVVGDFSSVWHPDHATIHPSQA